jgi:phospholipid transport system substrate-binding protein
MKNYKKILLVSLSVFGLSSVTAGSSHALQTLDIVRAPQSLLQINVSLGDKEVQGAKSFVNGVAQDGIGFLSDESLSAAKKSSSFRKLLQSNFDMQTIARFALGRYWRSASEAQRSEYLKLFDQMIFDVYSSRFGEYSGEELDVIDARADGKSDIIVNSMIKSKQGTEIKVDWRVRSKNSKYKIVDVIVEGVSMALTQRSDFSSVIQRGGGDVQVLIDHLKK